MRVRDTLVAALLFATMIMMNTAALAQQAVKAYACPKCEVASAKAMKCGCGEKMAAVNGRVAYVCTSCNTSSHKAGNCAKCSGALKKSLITYACEGCKVSSAKAGKCKGCGGALHKHIIPFKA